MMKFVENPNLPVCTDIVIIGEKYCNILQNGVGKLGINILSMPDNPYVAAFRREQAVACALSEREQLFTAAGRQGI